MRIYFRPLPWFTVFTLALMAGLIWLGIWQLHRREWKHDLIAAVEHNMAAAPISLDAALKLGKEAEYHKVALTGRFDHNKEGYVYAIANGVPAYHVITPFTADDGRTLLVDRGVIPQEMRDPRTRAAGNVEGKTRVVGVWRKPDPPGPFTPTADEKNRVWFSRDVDWIAKKDHIRLAAPVLIEADATPNPGGWPKGGQTVVTFRDAHLQYAITWFALALTLLICYFALHASMGRFGWRKPQ